MINAKNALNQYTKNVKAAAARIWSQWGPARLSVQIAGTSAVRAEARTACGSRSRCYNIPIGCRLERDRRLTIKEYSSLHLFSEYFDSPPISSRIELIYAKLDSGQNISKDLEFIAKYISERNATISDVELWEFAVWAMCMLVRPKSGLKMQHPTFSIEEKGDDTNERN